MSLWRMAGVWARNNIEIVEKDPKYFFSNITNLFAPNSIRALSTHVKYKINRALRFTWFRVAKIGEEESSSGCAFVKGS